MGGEVPDAALMQSHKPAVFGDQMQAVLLAPETPSDPGVTRHARPGHDRNARQGQPLPLPGDDLPQGAANLRQRPAVLTGTERRLEVLLFFMRSNGLYDNRSLVRLPGLGQRISSCVMPIWRGHCSAWRAKRLVSTKSEFDQARLVL